MQQSIFNNKLKWNLATTIKTEPAPHRIYDLGFFVILSEVEISYLGFGIYDLGFGTWNFRFGI